MSQPFDRTCSLPALGEVDREAGEFWSPNAFSMPTNGHNLSAYERNCLFLNRDGKSFLDASFASGADIDADSRSVIAADFDNDFAPDLLIGNVGGGPLRLFLNRFPKRNAVRIQLVGTKSNRSAIGARVTLAIGDRRIIRDLFPHNGFMGQAPAELNIGLGDANHINSINVRWPNGRVQTFADLPAGVRLTLREGDREATINR